MSKNFLKFGFSIFIINLLILKSFANSAQVPVNIQSVFFIKMLGYEKSLTNVSGNIQIKVLDCESDISKIFKTKFLKALSSAKNKSKIGKKTFDFSSFSLEQLKSASKSDLNILYVTPGCDDHLSLIKEMSNTNKFLTITGVPEYVQKSDLSVGLKRKDNGKAKMILNLRSLSKEGFKFNPKLLRLAEIIK